MNAPNDAILLPIVPIINWSVTLISYDFPDLFFSNQRICESLSLKERIALVRHIYWLTKAWALVPKLAIFMKHVFRIVFNAICNFLLVININLLINHIVRFTNGINQLIHTVLQLSMAMSANSLQRRLTNCVSWWFLDHQSWWGGKHVNDFYLA